MLRCAAFMADVLLFPPPSAPSAPRRRAARGPHLARDAVALEQEPRQGGKLIVELSDGIHGRRYPQLPAIPDGCSDYRDINAKA